MTLQIRLNFTIFLLFGDEDKIPKWDSILTSYFDARIGLNLDTYFLIDRKIRLKIHRDFTFYLKNFYSQDRSGFSTPKIAKLASQFSLKKYHQFSP